MQDETNDPQSILDAAYEPPHPSADAEPRTMEDAYAAPAETTEQEDILDTQPEITAPLPPEPIDIPIQNPGVMTAPVRDAKAAADAAADKLQQARHDGITVQLSEGDRSKFVQSALNDTEMIFDIELEGVSAEVEIAIPPEAWTAAAPLIIAKWGKKGLIDVSSELQWHLAFQMLHVYFQVRSVNGKPVGWSTSLAEGFNSGVKLTDVIEEATEHAYLTVSSISAARLSLMMEAMRTAENKYRHCLTAWHDRSFFTKADIG